MKVVKIVKNGTFYKIKMDDGNNYVFHDTVAYSFGLNKKNTEITQDKFNKALKANLPYEAFNKALKYLNNSKSKEEVKKHLSKFYDLNVVEETIEKLEKLKFIDDLKYAELTVGVLSRKGFGKYQIIEKLKEKKISDEFIEIALEEYSEEDELINCEKLLLKYLQTVKNESRMSLRKKVVSYLSQKGFSNVIITTTIEKNSEKLDNIIDEDENLAKAYQKLLRSKSKVEDEKKFKNKVIRSLGSKGFPLYKILKLLEVDYD